MSARDAEKESTFHLSHPQLQRPQADLYVFHLEGHDAKRSTWAMSLYDAKRSTWEIPIAWYCPQRCETQQGGVL